VVAIKAATTSMDTRSLTVINVGEFEFEFAIVSDDELKYR
jgi:hypothetical protein